MQGVSSVEEIIAYGLDESRMIRKYMDDLKIIEQEKGLDYVASQICLNSFGQGYGWQREVSIEMIDNSKIYILAMASKIKSLLESKLSLINGDAKDHYELLLLMSNRALKQ